MLLTRAATRSLPLFLPDSHMTTHELYSHCSPTVKLIRSSFVLTLSLDGERVRLHTCGKLCSGNVDPLNKRPSRTRFRREKSRI